MVHELLRDARRVQGLEIGIGIAYNHESPLRPPNFVSRKISLGVKKIAQGERETISIGNLDARRDWGYAGDYVKAMGLIGRKRLSEDFVIATGIQHSIRDFLRIAFDEVGIRNWESRVLSAPALFRPN